MLLGLGRDRRGDWWRVAGQGGLDFGLRLRGQQRESRKVDTQHTVSTKGDEFVSITGIDRRKETVASLRLPSEFLRMAEDVIDLHRQFGLVAVGGRIRHLVSGNDTNGEDCGEDGFDFVFHVCLMFNCYE